MKGEGAAGLYRDILDVYVYDTADDIRKQGRDGVNAFATGDEAIALMKAVDACTEVAPVNVKEARRRIAAKLIEDNDYRF
jgi:hypothetical protein